MVDEGDFFIAKPSVEDGWEASLLNAENTHFLERTLHARIGAAIPGGTQIEPVIKLIA